MGSATGSFFAMNWASPTACSVDLIWSSESATMHSIRLIGLALSVSPAHSDVKTFQKRMWAVLYSSLAAGDTFTDPCYCPCVAPQDSGQRLTPSVVGASCCLLSCPSHDQSLTVAVYGTPKRPHLEFWICNRLVRPASSEHNGKHCRSWIKGLCIISTADG